MNRRDFIKALVAAPVVAALPNPVAAAEELLDGVMYVTHSYLDADKVSFTETWSKMGGKIYRVLANEHGLFNVTEEPFAPFVLLKRSYHISDFA